jgi:serine/threonine-protein kinase TNNI3K
LFRLLNHPCLVNIIGAGFLDGGKVPFIISEYVAKGDLYELLHKEGSYAQIPEKIIHQWAMDIACGMLYLHEHSIIHRDLKSLNILVCKFL